MSFIMELNTHLALKQDRLKEDLERGRIVAGLTNASHQQGKPTDK